MSARRMGHGLVIRSDDEAIGDVLRQAAQALEPRDRQALAARPLGVIDARLRGERLAEALTIAPRLAVIEAAPTDQVAAWALLALPAIEHRLTPSPALLPRALKLVACGPMPASPPPSPRAAISPPEAAANGLAACLRHGPIAARMTVWRRDKPACLDACARDLRALGAQGRARDDALAALDELLMNALIDAPAIAGQAAAPAAVEVAWGGDADYLGVAVRDGYGLLTKARLVAAITAAQARGGAPRARADVIAETEVTPDAAAEVATDAAAMADEAGLAAAGAGIGLYLVASRVSHLVVAIAPGQATEVACLRHRQARIAGGTVHVTTQAAAK